jgi:cobalamin biosynthesis protein CbiG
MVAPSYMLEKPTPPARARTLLNQVTVPALIDIAAKVEELAERLAVHTRASPVATLGLALSAGYALSAVLRRRRQSLLF